MGKEGAVDGAAFPPAVVHGGAVDAHSHRTEPDDAFRSGRSDEGRIEIFPRVGIPTRSGVEHDEGLFRDGTVLLQLAFHVVRIDLVEGGCGGEVEEDAGHGIQGGEICFIDGLPAGDEMQRRIDVRARVIGHAEPHHLVGGIGAVAGHRAEFHRRIARGRRCRGDGLAEIDDVPGGHGSLLAGWCCIDDRQKHERMEALQSFHPFMLTAYHLKAKNCRSLYVSPGRRMGDGMEGMLMALG